MLLSAGVNAVWQGRRDRPGNSPSLRSLVSECTMHETLTPKEQETLDLIMEGCNLKETAQRMKIRVITVKHHRGQIFQKYGLSDFKGHKRVKLAVMVTQERNWQTP
jgi:DNA-binding NarL/FixJ family response regulator